MIIEVPAFFISKIKGIKYKFAVIVSAVVIFSLLAYAVYSIFPILIDEGKKMLPLITQAGGKIKVENLFPDVVFNPEISGWLNSLILQLSMKFTEFGGTVLNYVIQNVTNAMTAVILFAITASYFTNLNPTLKKNIWRFFPASSRNKSICFVRDYYKNLRHFIRGQVIIAILIGFIVGFGMFVSGIPYALFLGFLSGITNFIPFLGVIVATIPALLLGFSYQGTSGLIKVALVLVIANQLESWVFSPRIQSSRMKLNWFAIIISFFLCGAFFGIIGVLLAVPILVFLKDYWVEYVQEAFKKL